MFGSRTLTQEQQEMIEEIDQINEIFYKGKDFEGAFFDYMECMNKEKAKLIADYMEEKFNDESFNDAIWFKSKNSENEFLLIQGLSIHGKGVPQVIVFELLKDENSENGFKLVEKNPSVFVTFDKFQKLSDEEIEIFKKLNIQDQYAKQKDEDIFIKLSKEN